MKKFLLFYSINIKEDIEEKDLPDVGPNNEREFTMKTQK